MKTYLSIIAVTVLLAMNASGWAQGLGSALILVSALGFMIDGFAGRRAQPYTKALEALAAEHGTTTDESPP